MTKIEGTYQKRGVHLGRLLYWLQLPKQGISAQVAAKIIKEVAQELEDGKEYWNEPSRYPEAFREKLKEGTFPEHFWIDNYILQRCKEVQSKLIFGGIETVTDIIKLEELFKAIATSLVGLDNMIRPISNFLRVPNYLRPSVWWSKVKWIFLGS